MIDFKFECDVVKVGAKSSVGFMVELTAPQVASTQIESDPRGVVFVIDRSGSMGGGRLEIVKKTILDILGRLKKTDYLSVVSFDDQVDVVVEMTKIGDASIKDVRRKVSALQPGGSTNLEQGYRRGLAEAASAPRNVKVQVILLSDGQANEGSTEPIELGRIAARATEHMIATSTLGIGTGYDEKILVQMSNTGNGNHFAAVNQGEAELGLNSEIDALLTRAATDLKVTVKRAIHLKERGFIKAHNPVTERGGSEGIDWFTFGDLGSEEERNYLFELVYDAQPPFPSDYAGTLEVTVEYTDLVQNKKVQETKTLLLRLGNAQQWIEPARNEDVVMELAAIRAQEFKEQAIQLMREGRSAEARALLKKTGQDLAFLEESAFEMSPRNRVRARMHASEFMELSTFDGDEFIKRGEESVKRSRESKRDPRKNNNPKEGN